MNTTIAEINNFYNNGMENLRAETYARRVQYVRELLSQFEYIDKMSDNDCVGVFNYLNSVIITVNGKDVLDSCNDDGFREILPF